MIKLERGYDTSRGMVRQLSYYLWVTSKENVSDAEGNNKINFQEKDENPTKKTKENNEHDNWKVKGCKKRARFQKRQADNTSNGNSANGVNSYGSSQSQNTGFDSNSEDDSSNSGNQGNKYNPYNGPTAGTVEVTSITTSPPLPITTTASLATSSTPTSTTSFQETPLSSKSLDNNNVQTTPEASPGKSSKLTTGIVSGIVLAILVLFILGAYFGYRALRRHRKGKGVLRLPSDPETTYLPAMAHAIPAHGHLNRGFNEIPVLPHSLFLNYKNTDRSSFTEDFHSMASSSKHNLYTPDVGGYLHSDLVSNSTPTNEVDIHGSSLKRSSSAPSSQTPGKVLQMEPIINPEAIFVTKDQTIKVERIPGPQTETQSPPSPPQDPFNEQANVLPDVINDDGWEEDVFENTSEEAEDMAFSIEEGTFPKPPERLHGTSSHASVSSSKSNNE